MKTGRYFSVLLITVISISGCNLKVNKTITIGDGSRVRGSQNTINGQIYVGSDCVVRGACRSVNGSIKIGYNSEVEDIQAVNGGIRVQSDVIARGDIEAVNGSVLCDQGVQVHGRINTVNGSIELRKTLVERDVTTYNGDIELLDKSVVQGDIVVKKNKGKTGRRKPLRVTIAEESVVEGDIIVKDENMDVEVFLSYGGKVNGKIKNAEIIEE